MKALSIIISVFGLCISQIADAQDIKQWEIGVSADAGRSYYTKKYYGQPQLAPGWETKFKSDYLWSVGIQAEKHLASHLSAMAALRYTEEGVPDNMFCDCNNISESPYDDEKLYRAKLDGGLRYYINPTAKLVVFLDGRATMDWIIGIQQTRYRYPENELLHTMHWDLFGYSRFSPSIAFSVGVKWKRFSLDFGGASNIVRTVVRNPGTYGQVVHPVKTGFLNRGIFIKTAFNFLKIR